MQRFPTKSNLDVAKDAWQRIADSDDAEKELLTMIFEDSDIREKSKVYALDKLYNCNLHLDEKGYENLGRMLEEKYRKRIEEESDPSKADKIVEEISRKMYRTELGLSDYKRNRSVGLVFASKYCYFTNPKRRGGLFVIYDKYANDAINYIFTNDHSMSYGNKVRKVLGELKLRNPETEYRDLDKYLWLFGQTIQKKKTNTINYLINVAGIKDLIAKLAPQT